MIKQFLLALQFLTIVPVRVSGTVKEADLARSMRYYPLVGAMLGALSALLFKAALLMFSPAVAAVSAVAGLASSASAWRVHSS